MDRPFIISPLILALFSILLFSSGCDSKARNLTEAIETYNRAMKWGGPSAAETMIEEGERDKIVKSRIKQMRDRSVVEYGLSSLSLDSQDDTGTAIIQYSVVDQKTQSLIGINELQLWKLIKGKWYLSKIISSEQNNSGQNNIQ